MQANRSDDALGERVVSAALELGFARVGLAPASRLVRGEAALQSWLACGYHGDMDYMQRHGLRSAPQTLLSGARTLISVALAYARADAAHLPVLGTGTATTPRGFVARYARGDDYHIIMKEKLGLLAERVAQLSGRAVAFRACVDTAPLLEREAAMAAGLGFIAKSTLHIVPGVGTYVLLGELLVDVEIGPPPSAVEPRCGECTACLDACPTRAFVAPHVLDARRCISYLTIELRAAIPPELRPAIGTRVFGCDVCQEVCPFNNGRATAPTPLGYRPELDAVDLVRWLRMTASDYRRLVKRSALRRASRPQLMRNAAVALGNCGDPRVVGPLIEALEQNPYALVRAHVAWALGRLGGGAAVGALSRSAAGDSDATVRQEARDALAHLRQGGDSSATTGA